MRRPGYSRETAAGYAFLAPSLIGVVIFSLIPVIVVAVLSFARWDLISPVSWAGFDNYLFLAQDASIRNSVLVTALFTIFAIPAAIIIGLLLAVLLNRGLPGSGVLRVLYVLPWVCAPLVIGVVWRWIYSPSYGALNAILGVRVEWLQSPQLALLSVAFVYLWSQVGYISLFFLAGLQKIPASVYEAATIDGASGWTILRTITVPLLRPTTFFVSVTQVIASFQVFDLVYALTQGGPGGRTNVIANHIYTEAFVSLRFGRAAATAMVLFLVITVVTVLQQRYFSKRITYEMA